MGRLTDRCYDVTNKKWHWSIKSNSTNDGLVATPQDILDKLAHYEDMEEAGCIMVNTDKVVEQLEEIEVSRNEYSEIMECNIEPCTYTSCYECIRDKAIEIVKGGVNHEGDE